MKALVGLLRDCTTSPINRFAALLGTLQGNKKPSERTIFHFCDSEIFALRTQFEDGGTYKLILQEPILTSRGSCEGKKCRKILIIRSVSQNDFLPCAAYLGKQVRCCSSSCHDCSTVPDIMLRVPAQVTASQQTLTVATSQAPCVLLHRFHNWLYNHGEGPY